MRQKVKDLYEVITSRFYVGNEILRVGERRYEPVSLIGLFTLILDGRELVFGEYGSGKTTSSERISSLLLGLPLQFVQATTIHGHPEQTEEKIKATLDLAALEKEGNEVVKWKVTPFSPAIIIDEINRLPVGKQNMLLNEVDRNIWSYRGETLFFPYDKSFFATINYQDTGATNLIPPLLDRFDVAVETGRLHPLRKRLVRRGIKEGILEDGDFARKIVNYVVENAVSQNAHELTKYINECRDEFREKLEERFREEGMEIDIPGIDELRKAKEEIMETEVSDDTELFLDYIGQEVQCQLGLSKDFSKCSGCHYANYICSDLYSISGRAEKSIFKYAKALAWLNNEEVGLEHLLAIIPYTLWHRSAVNDELLSRIRDVEKESSDKIYAIEEIMGSVKDRWYEHREYQIDAYRSVQEGDYERVKEIAKKINHPFFKSLIREI
ncbi:MAG: AAA family ATPase [Halobacteriota archaeon]